MFDAYAHVFHIPADLDDTSVNLALGGLLSQLQSKFPSLYQKWESANPDIPTLFKLETQVILLSFYCQSNIIRLLKTNIINLCTVFLQAFVYR